MKATGETFYIQYQGQLVAVDTYKSKGQEVYHVKLPGKELLFITLTVHGDTFDEFWTSVPPGNLTLAKELGKAIQERHDQPKQKFLF